MALNEFEEFSLEALGSAALAWVIGLLIMGAIYALVWPWEGGKNWGKRIYHAPTLAGEMGWSPTSIPAEKLMLLGWLYFWVVVLVGVALTNYRELDRADTLLTRVFGYNNICVNFDFPPASYALPFLWAICCFFLCMYTMVRMILLARDVVEGKMSRGLCRVLRGLGVFALVSFLFFSTIFAVTPEPADEDPHHITLMIHTFPFTVLQYGLLAIMVMVSVHYTVVGHWAELGFSHTPCKWISVAYCSLYLVIIVVKTWASWGAITKHDVVDTRRLVDSGIAELCDKGFMLLAAVLPVFFSSYLLAFKYDKLYKLQLNLGVTSKKAGAGEPAGP